MNNQDRIATLIQMLLQEPEDEFLNYALGLEYAKDLSSYSKAESQFNKVLQNNGSYIAAYYQLGQLYEQIGKKQEAIEAYQKGLSKAIAQKNNKAINEFNEAIFLLEE